MEDLFFLISKIGSFFYRPSNLIFFFLIILFFYIPKVNFLIKSIYFSILLILFFPFGLLILKSLEERIPLTKNIPSEIKNIIVLGGFEELDLFIDREQLSFNSSSERIILAVKLSNQFKNSKIVFVGGDSSLKVRKNDNITNEDLVKEFFEIIQFDSNRYMFSTPENDPYNEAILKKYYSNHNYLVLEYFKSRPNKLIVINVTRDEDYLRLCKFLGKKPKSEKFPWENKTSTI